jgi:hypothetical protein
VQMHIHICENIHIHTHAYTYMCKHIHTHIEYGVNSRQQ